MEETTKKTGQTPIVIEGTDGSRVLRVAEVKAVLVEYLDGETGKTDTALGFLIGDEVRFLDKKVISARASKWLASGVIEHLRSK